MRERETDLRDRHQRPFGEAPSADAIAVAETAPALRKLRRRRLAVALVLTAAVAAGGGLSMLPRTPRVVTQQVSRPGGAQGSVEMRLDETSRGFPFRTWVMQRGPAGEAITTHANFALKVTGIILNVALVAVVGVLGLAAVGAGRRED